LLEILVAVAVVALILIILVRLVSGTAATINAANKHVDTASMARIVLDRFGTDFAGAILSDGATALYLSEPDQPGAPGNSAIGFVTASRARGPTTQTNPWTTDTRSAFVGYRVRSVTQNVGGGKTPSLPCLNRGDGRFTLSVNDMSNSASYNLWDVFGAANLRMPNDLTATSNDQHVLNWQPIASSIFRFHISFVLDDGRVVQSPPQYNAFFANGGTGGCIPIAFSRQASADPNGRYVKGLIVGVVVLDETTRDLVYKVDNNFSATIGAKLSRPMFDGETPTAVWTRNLRALTSSNPSAANYLFQPVRENVRFYQQFYSVNL
jgi:type II secretory pathway pseudopilin PulG